MKLLNWLVSLTIQLLFCFGLYLGSSTIREMNACRYVSLTPKKQQMLPTTIEKIYDLYLMCSQNISTDSRSIFPQSLFFCLKGENFDGNQFAKLAIENGAQFAIADNAAVCDNKQIWFVENALRALQELAHFHRNQIRGKCQIVAIGGSNGKTTTKELCFAAIQHQKRVLATEANYNNHIGVPLTILKIKNEEIAIIELGTNHPGEMKLLCEIADPDIGIVTNVGKEHLEGFGDIESVAREESELYLQLQKNGGIALVNSDDAWLQNMSKRLSNKKHFGLIADSNEFHCQILVTMPSAQFIFSSSTNSYPVKLQLGGKHNVYNALAALSLCSVLQLSTEISIRNIENYAPQNNRSQWILNNKFHVLLDAYNANPSSMEITIKELFSIPGNKILCLGDMLELGNHADAEHANLIDMIRKEKPTMAFFAGDIFLRNQLNVPNFYFLNNSEECLNLLKKMNLPKSTVLIKGSRSLKMEKVLPAFLTQDENNVH